MGEESGATFVSMTDEDGKEVILEYVDTVEYDGVIYQAFFPAEIEGEPEDDDAGLIILKSIQENGEELLSTPDTDEELEAVYNILMEQIFDADYDGS